MPVKINNAFDVSLPPARAWEVLMDVERIVPCVPGAELLEVIDERTYKGKVSVKLGPVALSFNGRVAFDEINDEDHSATLRAQGQDDKGRGGANATVDFRVTGNGAGSRVEIDTDLMLSGTVAQYGRAQGVIAQVADEIVSQFADCLAERLDRDANQTMAGEPASAAQPLSAFALIMSVVRNAIARLFRRT